MNEKLRENADEETIDLVALFMAVLRHWKIIAIVTVLFAVGSFLFSRYMITPKYASMSRLYVFSKSTSITSLADIQMGSNLTNDYLIVVSSRPVLDQVIYDLSLDETYRTLVKKLQVKNPSNTRFLDITVTDGDPVRAKAIADDIAEVSARFIAEKMDQDPPSIIQYGYADEEKVSPSLRKNTAIGGLAGAFITVALVVLFYLINNTIDSADDVESKLGLKLIAQIPLEHDENEGHSKRKKEKKVKKVKKEKKVRRAKQ